MALIIQKYRLVSADQTWCVCTAVQNAVEVAHTLLTCTRITGIICLKVIVMTKRIETPTVGEILSEEFMKPYGVSAYRLAKEIGVPTSRIQDILHNRRKITPETSLRLSKVFGVSEKYFLDIQNDIDIRNLKEQLASDINSIRALKPA